MRISTRVIGGALIATLLTQLTACGTIFYPDRRGQIGGKIDPVVAAMDAIGIHEPLIVGYFGAAVGNEPLTSLLVTVKPRFRPGIDVDQMRM